MKAWLGHSLPTSPLTRHFLLSELQLLHLASQGAELMTPTLPLSSISLWVQGSWDLDMGQSLLQAVIIPLLTIAKVAFSNRVSPYTQGQSVVSLRIFP